MTEGIELPELQHLIDQQAQLVEVLPPAEYAGVHLSGAVNNPLKRLDKDSTELDRRRLIVVYCYDYLRGMSPLAACRLETLGFEHVHV